MTLNKPKISFFIAFFYVFIAFLLLLLLLNLKTKNTYLAVLLLLFLFVLLYHILWIFLTRYAVEKGVLTIFSLYGKKKIRIKEIKTMQREDPPIFIKIFGSGFFTGHYYSKKKEMVYVTMTNFDDGLFIKTKNNSQYFITPRNPEKFIKLLKV